jgi:putative hemolysin
MLKIEMKLDLRKNNQGEEEVLLFRSNSYMGKGLNLLAKILKKPLLLDQIHSFLKNFFHHYNSETPYFGQLSQAMGLSVQTNHFQTQDIPKTGPLIIYANHPCFALEAFATLGMLEKVRADFKMVGITHLSVLPFFEENNFLVDVLKTQLSREKNKKTIERIESHLKENKALWIFPAGKISCQKLFSLKPPTDLPWQAGIAHFASLNPEIQLIPVYCEGSPSQLYLFVRRFSLFLANFLVLREISLLMKTTIKMHFGAKIKAEELMNFSLDEKLVFLRSKIDALEASAKAFIK